jgi:hypothetical protein
VDQNLPVQGGAAGAAAAKQGQTAHANQQWRLNQGNSLYSVLGFPQHMVPEPSKKKKKQKLLKPPLNSEIKYWKGYPYRIDQNRWWTWVHDDQGVLKRPRPVNLPTRMRANLLTPPPGEEPARKEQHLDHLPASGRLGPGPQAQVNSLPQNQTTTPKRASRGRKCH